MITRRDLLRASAAAGLAAGVQPVTARARETAKSSRGAAPRTFVLVHGAWHGGWCWRLVANALRAAGHTVHVPTLTGLGERSHLASRDVNLSTHATDVVRVLECEELEDIVLVGHSYAGHVVPLVADQARRRIRQLIFLDAVIARDGQPFPMAPDAREARIRGAIDGYLDPPPPLSFFGVPADHPLAPWVARRLTPQPLGTLLQTVQFRHGGAEGLPKTYIRCLRRRDMSQPDLMEAQIKGQPEWTWRTIDTGHDAMVTAPHELTELLMQNAV